MMRNIYYFSMFLIGLFGIIFAVSAGKIIMLEAEIPASESYMMIEVEDSVLNFSEVNKGESSSSKSTCINNTGTEEVLVTFEINDSSEFSNYLFIKNYSSGRYTSLSSFGIFLLNSGSERRKCVRFILNLTDYDEPVYRRVYYQANVTVVASPYS